MLFRFVILFTSFTPLSWLRDCTLSLGIRIISTSPSKLVRIIVTHFGDVLTSKATVFFLVSRLIITTHLSLRATIHPRCLLNTSLSTILHASRGRNAHEFLTGLLREFPFILQLTWIVNKLQQSLNFVSQLYSLFKPVWFFIGEIFECSDFVKIIFNVLDYTRCTIFDKIVHNV